MAAKTIITKPEAELSGNENLPKGFSPLNPNGNYEQVFQGFAKTTNDGTSLYSEGFSHCYGLIIRDQSTLDSALFHIDDMYLRKDRTHNQTGHLYQFIKKFLGKFDIDPNQRKKLETAIEHLTWYKPPENYGHMPQDEVEKIMRKLNSSGDLTAQFVGSTNSEIGASSSALDSKLGFNVQKEIIVDVGKAYYSIEYDPLENKVYVQSPELDKILRFKFGTDKLNKSKATRAA